VDDKTIEKAFLAELEALERFRISYTGLYPRVPLTREDPDIRRLLEALAFFSARTRVTAERAVNGNLLRLFQQQFSYVLGPVPAVTMLQAEPTDRYVSALDLPRGMDLIVSRSGAKDRARYRFKTTAPLRLLPIRLEGVEMRAVRGVGYRIALRFVSPHPTSVALDAVSLHINHLNDLAASMAVRHAIATHLVSASVVFDKGARDEGGQPCRVEFGAPRPAPHETEPFEQPIQRFRSFLQYPQAEMFLHARGIRAPAGWQRFSLVLDVDGAWPPELSLTADSFVLHAVPVVNIKQDMANPIRCDGTQERYAVRHPDGGLCPQAILGVYRMTDGGMAPIAPSVLGSDQAGYEVVFEGKGAERTAWLSLDLPGAFERPERVAVEALWMQPDLGEARVGELEINVEELQARLFDRHVEGVAWSCVGTLAPSAASDVEDDRVKLLRLMAMKNQRALSLEDLVFLLQALGVQRRPEFSRLVSQLKALDLDRKPAGRRAGGSALVYQLTFDRLEGPDLPALELFCARLHEMLEAWGMEPVLEVHALVPRLGFQKRYP
jgi:type VI secretion system protein ImpG